MTTTLDAILDAQADEQLSLDDLLALLEQEAANGNCEVQALCREMAGIPPGSSYRCGWIGAGTVHGCPKRRRLMGGQR